MEIEGKLKFFRFSSVKKMNNKDCSICWESGETKTYFCCNHNYHLSCIRQWGNNIPHDRDFSCVVCNNSKLTRKARKLNFTVRKIPKNYATIPTAEEKAMLEGLGNQQCPECGVWTYRYTGCEMVTCENCRKTFRHKNSEKFVGDDGYGPPTITDLCKIVAFLLCVIGYMSLLTHIGDRPLLVSSDIPDKIRTQLDISLANIDSEISNFETKIKNTRKFYTQKMLTEILTNLILDKIALENMSNGSSHIRRKYMVSDRDNFPLVLSRNYRELILLDFFQYLLSYPPYCVNRDYSRYYVMVSDVNPFQVKKCILA